MKIGTKILATLPTTKFKGLPKICIISTPLDLLSTKNIESIAETSIPSF